MTNMIFTGTPSGLRKRLQNCFVISMCQSNRASLFIAILLGLTSNLGFVTDAAPLILFEDSLFRGARVEYILDASETCVNIRGKLNDIFSSAQNTESGACYLLCEHEFCRGRCVRVTGSVTNLRTLNFNDMASSIKRCPPSGISTAQVEPTSSSTTQRTSTTLLRASTASSSNQSIILGALITREGQVQLIRNATQNGTHNVEKQRPSPVLRREASPVSSQAWRLEAQEEHSSSLSNDDQQVTTAISPQPPAGSPSSKTPSPSLPVNSTASTRDSTSFSTG